MSRWLATPALARAVLVAGVGLVVGVLVGAPEMVVLASAFVLPAALGLLGRPTTAPGARALLGNYRLYEGQGTRSRLVLREATEVEQATRVGEAMPYVVVRPASVAMAALAGDPALDMGISPRRWGKRSLGVERVALTSRWAGYRWVEQLVPQDLQVWPQPAAYDSSAQSPEPSGLVGRHRSRQVGSGSEFAGIRPFAPGDRLRRISWPVSLRTRELQVVTTLAEEDTSVLVLVDALTDIGVSGGVDGHASSLDLTVRAAAALVEHHIRGGDRVAIRVLGAQEQRVDFGSGTRHLHRLIGTLSRLSTSAKAREPEGHLELGLRGGCVVYVLSTMLSPAVVNAVATAASRVSVVAIDTLGERPLDEIGGPTSTAGLAWRMRLIERETTLRRLAATGCPVVAWRGPGTLDEALLQQSRRAQRPRLRGR